MSCMDVNQKKWPWPLGLLAGSPARSMKIAICLATASSLSCQLSGPGTPPPEPNWQIQTGTLAAPEGIVYHHLLKRGPADHLYLAGHLDRSNTAHTAHEIQISKFDRKGRFVWSSSVFDTLLQPSELAPIRDVAIDTDQNIYSFGSKFSSASIDPSLPDDVDWVLSKLDNAGNLVWQNIISTPSTGGANNVSIQMILGDDNQLYTVGYSHYALDATISDSVELRAYSLDGVKLWEKLINVTSAAFGYVHIAYHSGAVYLSYPQNRPTDGLNSPFQWIIEHYDTAGNLVWQTALTETHPTLSASQLQTDAAGNLYLIAKVSAIPTTATSGQYVQKIAVDGTPSWRIDITRPYQATVSPPGELYILLGETDVGLAKYDSNGSLVHQNPVPFSAQAGTYPVNAGYRKLLVDPIAQRIFVRSNVLNATKTAQWSVTSILSTNGTHLASIEFPYTAPTEFPFQPRLGVIALEDSGFFYHGNTTILNKVNITELLKK